MKITPELIRVAFKAFGKDNQEITNAQIYEVLEARNDADQAKIRTRIAEMVRHGEVTKVSPGTHNNEV